MNLVLFIVDLLWIMDLVFFTFSLDENRWLFLCRYRHIYDTPPPRDVVVVVGLARFGYLWGYAGRVTHA